ncbi:HK97 family phage prohead protease [Pseudonocardia sp. RS010]|uniref:HK97 family phage prohead protease n=1 Tax=Pseudonocardia sp. RS010 TaxID=3385979 RepID=UPI0039A175C9
MNAVTRFAVEIRSEITGNKLHGHAAVFGQAADLGSHLEQLAVTAFRSVLADVNTDVRALWNHNSDHLLGRQSSGTLRLSTDSEGLQFEVDLPDTTVGRDVRILAERGDLTGASFGFVPGQDSWSTVGERRMRTHTSVSRLVDVSPVTFPAYDGASVAMRAYSFGSPNRRASQLIRARARVRLGRA